MIQDWELECSDPDRLDEMLDLYANLEDADDKQALMALMLGSLETLFCRNSINLEIVESVRRLIATDWNLHAPAVRYWALLGEEDEDNVFPITLFARQQWVGVKNGDAILIYQ